MHILKLLSGAVWWIVAAAAAGGAGAVGRLSNNQRQLLPSVPGDAHHQVAQSW